MKLSVRSGDGSAPVLTASASARARPYNVAHPLASSFAPGSWTCATITMRSAGRDVPRISATSERFGPS